MKKDILLVIIIVLAFFGTALIKKEIDKEEDHYVLYNVSIMKDSIQYDCRIRSLALTEGSCLIYLEGFLEDSLLNETELKEQYNNPFFVFSQYSELLNVVMIDRRHYADSCYINPLMEGYDE